MLGSAWHKTSANGTAKNKCFIWERKTTFKKIRHVLGQLIKVQSFKNVKRQKKAQNPSQESYYSVSNEHIQHCD